MSDNRGGPWLAKSNDSGRYQHLIEHVQDAVVEFELVDDEPIVRAVNQAFVDLFEYPSAEIRGESLNEYIVPEWLADEARTLDEQTAAGEVNYRRVKRETASGLRAFLYRGIPYGADDARTGGFAVYTDLTEIIRREHRLQVLNRVLRHNLRNNANVILAQTTRLLDQLEEQTTETTAAAAAVEKAAANLATLAREAGDIDTILSESPAEPSAIDCVPLIRAVVQHHRQQSPAATIRTDLPQSMPVNADEHLRFAIDGLVENAIEHHPSNSPLVRVRAATANADGWVNIHVEDDCPKIPPNELDVVTEAEEITQTCHGTGLGLWLVKWTTEMFGGELSFGTSEFGGNDVCLRLPRG